MVDYTSTQEVYTPYISDEKVVKNSFLCVTDGICLKDTFSIPRVSKEDYLNVSICVVLNLVLEKIPFVTDEKKIFTAIWLELNSCQPKTIILWAFIQPAKYINIPSFTNSMPWPNRWHLSKTMLKHYSSVSERRQPLALSKRAGAS